MQPMKPERGPDPVVTLRSATATDVSRYVEIEQRVGSRTYATITDPEEALGEINKGSMYMIEVDGAVVGRVAYERKDDGSVYLSDLVIEPAYQNRGLGRVALAKVLEEVGDAKKVWLVTHPDNANAIHLYESFGFAQTGRKEDYFGDGEPRIILTLSRLE